MPQIFDKINKIVSRSYKCLRIIACCRMHMYQPEWQGNLVCGFVGRSFSRGFLDLPQDDCTIRKGRNEMANALRNNQVAPLQCAWYAPTMMDVELRAVMHQDVSGTSSCSVTAWLGTLDLLGWGLEVDTYSTSSMETISW